MSDDPTAMRDMATQIGNLNGTLGQFLRNQEKTNDRIMDLMEKHVDKDEKSHGTISKDIESLKTSRKVQRAVVATATVGSVGGAGVGMKVGWLGKILSVLAAATSAGTGITP